ncbi:MAG: sulfurtransferase TusA family protein [Candidatus Melainabacteria bacterium]|nr:sulfurtransferase TusA family protein [Candidatus Melainabacteria bacterium]MBI3308208.1 sulfurtransferase TusA family protein [Candidatus Melainabacteria bacterium]
MKQDMSNVLLDLRGIECPINFVKTKIKLDEMNSGQMLEVWLDPGEAIESVSQSVLEEGHKIIEQIEQDGYFKLFVRKK